MKDECTPESFEFPIINVNSDLGGCFQAALYIWADLFLISNLVDIKIALKLGVYSLA